MKKLNKKGFTLVELIVVIAILAVLAVIAIPMLSGWVAQGKASRAKSDVKTVQSACNAAVAAVAAGLADSVQAELTKTLDGEVTGTSVTTIGKTVVNYSVSGGICTATES